MKDWKLKIEPYKGEVHGLAADTELIEDNTSTHECSRCSQCDACFECYANKMDRLEEANNLLKTIFADLGNIMYNIEVGKHRTNLIAATEIRAAIDDYFAKYEE